MFILNNNDPAPLYKQLYHQIRAQVLSGELPADSRLPSVRDLATELSTSRNTVEGAYQELYAEGYIYSRPRSGYFVSALDHDAAPLPLPRASRKEDRVEEASPAYRYDFHPARLDRQSFPAQLWRKLFVESLRNNSRQLVQYGELQGEWNLRCAIRRYLERSRGVLCDQEQIIVCAGLQQGLDLVALMLKENHSALAAEDPGYHLPRAVFRNHGYEIVPVPVGANGLDLDLLIAGRSTIAYVTPSHQLPMGYVMPVANRLKLIEWAESGNTFIIEDDYDSELRYHGKPIPSLQGLRPQGNIIYSGTFSKVLSPALRMSYLVLPRSLLPVYRRLFRDYFSTVPFLEQHTLARFMEEGHWDRHIRRMRIIYKKKHDTLLRAVERHFGPRATVIGQGAGLHVVLQLDGAGRCEAEIIRRAQDQGIRLLPFSDTCVSDASAGHTRLLLGFGGMTAGDIEPGIALLSQACF
ncbi:PLP-dependent aminotransferase family protein [Geobacter sp. SVR]|uniref:MocR-like pyridoxine biosynthesis transcription factor PdxR n=1 Tax=Geobacter sp. SVR TaxID=2495594 RepID=UPI00143F00CE|nr:PLP-dependent aminotransferase family protein [Geobacter sp. SVR]BCS55236.1 GntR family transcriptional regulator [Geobacter sp. SVR]GCF86035.1 GntR family transcriptional regulator [Geobacter sp. SVR]